MFEIDLPYDETSMTLRLPEERLAGVLRGRQGEYVAERSQERLVEDALDHPYGSPTLEEMAAGKRNIVIISSDHTRPLPSRITMPILLRRIRSAAPEARVRILVATGMHRASTHDELVAKYGEDIVANEEIVMHDARDDAAMVNLGTLPSGGDCIISHVAAEADLLVAEGFIEPHLLAGYSGSRKSVLPGIASWRTIMYCHNGQFVADEHSRPGNLAGNLAHADMMAAARMARLEFILNVALNATHEVIGAFAGDMAEAHEAGCAFVDGLCGADAVPADIAVVTNGGYPLDQCIYQVVKGMHTASLALGEGGVIVAVAGCRDGHGSETFFRAISESNPADLERACVERPRGETQPDQWAGQVFAHILAHHPVILVSDLCDHGVIESMHMRAASTLDEAMEVAFSIAGADARVAVIPDGVATMIR